MTDLYLASTVFLASHLIPVYLPLRQFLVRCLTERVYIGLYICLSVSLFYWLVTSFLNAPYQELWIQQSWHRWVPSILMLPSCLLGVIGMTSPNPFSFGLGQNNYDPAKPGIVRLMRHPVIVSLGIWSLAHITVNGDAAGLTGFGLMLTLLLMGTVSMNRRMIAKIGIEKHQQLRHQTRETPVLRALSQIKLWQWLAAVSVYIFLFLLHDLIIGVSPLP